MRTNQPSGGGSGGGRSDQVAGVHAISGNRVEITSRIPMAADPTDLTPPTTSAITLLALGETPVGIGPGGFIDLRGNQGVRISAGPPLLEILPTSSSSTDGIEMAAAMTKKITLQQGLEGIGPSLAMADSGVTLDSGLAGSLVLESLTNITLKVAGGLASITLTPTGVEIKGLIVNVN
jgi:hypothetical protein